MAKAYRSKGRELSFLTQSPIKVQGSRYALRVFRKTIGFLGQKEGMRMHLSDGPLKRSVTWMLQLLDRNQKRRLTKSARIKRDLPEKN